MRNTPLECLANPSPGVRTVTPAPAAEDGRPEASFRPRPASSRFSFGRGRSGCYPTPPAILNPASVLIFYLDEKCVVYTLSQNK